MSAVSNNTTGAVATGANTDNTAPTKRGAFIVFEGVDRSGKSTQCRQLLSYLKNANISHEFLRYPDRSSESGKLINSYLQGGKNMGDRAIHLLFAANRHEDTPKILDLLNNGVNIICDRYSYSGAAYSAAKIAKTSANAADDNKDGEANRTDGTDGTDGKDSQLQLIDWEQVMKLDWCMACEQGLPKPDLVIYLNIEMEEAQRRGGFGNERYEKVDFLRRVQICYKQMQHMHKNDNMWKILDANRSKEEIHEEIVKIVEDTIAQASKKEIAYM